MFAQRMMYVFTVFRFIFFQSLVFPVVSWKPILKKWKVLGPFPVGKTEYDADPVEVRGGVLKLLYDSSSSSGKNTKSKDKNTKGKSSFPPFFSELVRGGVIRGWKKLVSTHDSILIDWNQEVDWNRIVQGLNSIEASSFQAWVVGEFKPKESGWHQMRCLGVHTFLLEKWSNMVAKYGEAAKHGEDERNYDDSQVGNSTKMPPTLLTGDVYRNTGVANVVFLERDTRYFLHFKISAKFRAQFTCSTRRIGEKNAQKDNNDQKDSGTSHHIMTFDQQEHTPDLLDGQIFALGSRLFSVRYHVKENPVEVQKVKFRIIHASPEELIAKLGEMSVEISLDSRFNNVPVTLAPGQTGVLPLELKMTKPAMKLPALPKFKKVEKEKCMRLDIESYIQQKDGSKITIATPLQVFFDCRHSKQSFIFSYRDQDGGVGVAGLSLPIQDADSSKNSVAKTPNSCPVLLTMAGVGVLPRQAVDSHKFKPRNKAKSDDPMQYQLKNRYILAPSRNGAHNWEGQGLNAAFSALEDLVQKTGNTTLVQKVGDTTLVAKSDSTKALCPADSSHLLVAGHSRGGHGALMVATKIPDQVQKLFVANGWHNRNSYGDANTIFREDVHLESIDPSLKSIFESTIWENDNIFHIQNLCGMPTLFRTSSKDDTVPPHYMRKVQRQIVGACSSSSTTLGSPHADGDSLHQWSEIATQSHWWWDTKYPNDGGVMMDEAVRKFLLENSTMNTTRPAIAVDASAGIEAAMGNVVDRDSVDEGETSFSPSCSTEKGSLEGTSYEEGIESTNLVFTVSAFNPGTYMSGKRGVRILQQNLMMRKTEIEVSSLVHNFGNGNQCRSKSSGVVHLKSINVASFHMQRQSDGKAPTLLAEILADLESSDEKMRFLQVDQTRFFVGDLFSAIQSSRRASSLDSIARITFVRDDGTLQGSRDWRITGVNVDGDENTDLNAKLVAPLAGPRGPNLYGPARRVVDNPFIIVVGTTSGFSGKLAEIGTYLASQHYAAQGTTCVVVKDVDFIGRSDSNENGNVTPNLNLILVGGPADNTVTQKILEKNAKDEQLTMDRGRTNSGSEFSLTLNNANSQSQSIAIRNILKLGHCHLKTQAAAVFVTYHRKNLVLVLSHVGDSVDILQDLVKYNFASEQSLTRAPFTNMIPDFLVVGRDFKSKGYGGVISAGWFNNDWKLQRETSWTGKC